jgi:hypothetical protein
MKSRLFLLTFVFGTFLSPWVNAYVTYNRMGYVSCGACHFSPTGGGLVTAYGRSVGAAVSFFNQELNPPEQRVYQGLHLRALQLDSSERANPFLMQADYLLSAALASKIRLDLRLGPNFKQAQSSFVSIPSGWDGWVVHRAMLNVELTEEGSIQVGRDIALSGLNIDDHISFLKSRNRRGVFDYPTQLRYIHQTENLQLIPYLLAPSFEESSSNREYGGGFRGEYAFNSNNSAGLTGLFGNSPAITRYSTGAFFRLSQAHWNGFAGEYVFTHLRPHISASGFDQHTVYLKSYLAVPEWVETSWVLEYLNRTEPFAETGFQYGPEVNVRIQEFVSLMGAGRKETRAGSNQNADWSWYGQVFLHFQI